MNFIFFISYSLKSINSLWVLLAKWHLVLPSIIGILFIIIIITKFNRDIKLSNIDFSLIKQLVLIMKVHIHSTIIDKQTKINHKIFPS